MAREHLASRLIQKRSSVEQAIGLYSELVLCVSPLATLQVVMRDPHDDHVIACAVAAHADAIVSGDRDLLDLTERPGIAILTAAQALAHIG